MLSGLPKLSSQHYQVVGVITVAPVKALCVERFTDWQVKFSPLGLRCTMVTGDTDVDGDVSDLNSLQNFELVVTTPEKWDFLTRRWRDYQHIMNTINIFLIDEVRDNLWQVVFPRDYLTRHVPYSLGTVHNLRDPF